MPVRMYRKGNPCSPPMTATVEVSTEVCQNKTAMTPSALCVFVLVNFYCQLDTPESPEGERQLKNCLHLTLRLALPVRDYLTDSWCRRVQFAVGSTLPSNGPGLCKKASREQAGEGALKSHSHFQLSFVSFRIIIL